MTKISDYLQGLVTQRNNLANTLRDYGINASTNETFNTLIPKINSIESGSVSGVSKKLYSFGLMSDIHLKDTSMGQWDDNDSVNKFNRALDFFEDKDVDFVTIAGDNLAINTRYPSAETPLTPTEIKTSEETWINEVLLYKNEVSKRTKFPIYTVLGNHDVCALAHYANSPDTLLGSNYTITTSDPAYTDYVGKTCEEIWKQEIGDYNYVIEKDDDIFIYFSMYYWHYRDFCRQEDLDWLTLKLSEYGDRRVFLVAHMPQPHIFDELSTATGLMLGFDKMAPKFIDLLNKYPNVIQLSGHLHYVLDYEGDANFTNPNTHIIDGGATIIRCSSGAYTRLTGEPYVNVPEGSQGYIVDVYEDKTVFRGIDFSGEPKSIDKANYVVTV